MSDNRFFHDSVHAGFLTLNGSGGWCSAEVRGLSNALASSSTCSLSVEFFKSAESVANKVSKCTGTLRAPAISCRTPRLGCRFPASMRDRWLAETLSAAASSTWLSSRAALTIFIAFPYFIDVPSKMQLLGHPRHRRSEVPRLRYTSQR